MDLNNPKNNPNIVNYLNVRKIHQKVANSMMKYIDKNNIDPEKLLISIDEKLEIEMFELDFDNQLDNQVFADLIIYPHVKEIKSVTEIYLEKGRLAKEKAMLEAMKNSQVGFFEVIKRDDFNKISTLKNIVTNETIELSDMRLGEYGTAKGFYFFIRIISYNGVNFQTGLSMIFKRNVTIKAWIKRHHSAFKTNQSAVLIVDLFNFYQKYGYKQAVIDYIADGKTTQPYTYESFLEMLKKYNDD